VILRKITPDGAMSTCFDTLLAVVGGVAIDADGCVVVCTGDQTVAKIAGCSAAMAFHGPFRLLECVGVGPQLILSRSIRAGV
jgi:hypothetical protein